VTFSKLFATHGACFTAWLLAVAIVAQCVSIVANVVHERREPAAAPHVAAGTPRPHVDLGGVIAGAHLFGDAQAVPLVAQADAPATSASLVLTGTIAVSDPRKGKAMLGENAGSSRLKSVGETVAGGALLHAVFPDHVLLDAGGQLQSLWLPRQASGKALLTRAGDPEQAAADDGVSTLIASDPSIVSDIMRPQMVYVNGKASGVRVFPGRNHAAFQHLGLLPGDTVTAINGTPVESATLTETSFRSAQRSGDVQVTVIRDGKPEALRISMAQVNQDAERVVRDDGMRPASEIGEIAPIISSP
jgi:general secretion pathway protein C